MRGVVKIGGASGNSMVPLMREIATRVTKGEEWVVVHGASATMNKLCGDLDVAPTHVVSPGGYRSRFVGPREQVLFEMASGRNSLSVAECLGLEGGQPFPLFPSSHRSVQAIRKKNLRILQEGRTKILRGNYSGKVCHVYTQEMETILSRSGVPILPPLGYDQESQLLLNLDGDRLAAAVAVALEASVMIIATNVPGLLKDPENEKSLVAQGSLEDWEYLESLAAGNMKRKILACEEALQGGVPKVIICDSRVPDPLDQAFQGGGTHLWGNRSMARAM